LARTTTATSWAAEVPLLALLWGANLAVFTADLMMNALYPALAMRFGVPLETVVLLTTPRMLGQIGVLALGALSDRVGRAAVLAAGLFLVALAGWGGALAPGLGVMILAQGAMGLGFAVVTTIIPCVVGDRYRYEIRGRLLSLIQFALPFALIAVVPTIIALAGRYTVATPFMALGTAAGLLGLLSAWRLPRAMAAGTARPAPGSAKPASWVRPDVLAIVAVCLLMAIVPTAIFGFLAGWVGATFGDPDRTVSLAFACDGIGALLGVSLSAYLVDRLHKRWAAVVGLALTGCCTLLLPGTRGALPLMLLAVGGLAAFNEIGYIASPALLGQMAPQARGTILSVWATALAIGGAIAPWLARPLWQRWGMQGLGWAGGALLIVLAGLLALVQAEPD